MGGTWAEHAASDVDAGVLGEDVSNWDVEGGVGDEEEDAGLDSECG